MLCRPVGLLLLVAAAGPAAAQPEPFRFRFPPGEVFTYAVEQTTTVAETTPDEKTGAPATARTGTRLSLTRRWEVKGVDPAGVATLAMSITALRQEITRPGPPDKDGQPTTDTLVIDSATPDGAKQVAEYLNKPIVTVAVDPQGRVRDVTAAGGSADRVRAELPFRLAFPDAPVPAGGAWARPFTITLDPPAGAGEKFAAIQTYTLKGVADGVASIAVSSALKEPPADAALLPPLAPFLWDGEVFFRPADGRYAGARLAVRREVPNHQGAGSKFVYESRLTETAAK